MTSGALRQPQQTGEACGGGQCRRRGGSQRRSTTSTVHRASPRGYRGWGGGGGTIHGEQSERHATHRLGLPGVALPPPGLTGVLASVWLICARMRASMAVRAAHARFSSLMRTHLRSVPHRTRAYHTGPGNHKQRHPPVGRRKGRGRAPLPYNKNPNNNTQCKCTRHTGPVLGLVLNGEREDGRDNEQRMLNGPQCPDDGPGVWLMVALPTHNTQQHQGSRVRQGAPRLPCTCLAHATDGRDVVPHGERKHVCEGGRGENGRWHALPLSCTPGRQSTGETTASSAGS